MPSNVISRRTSVIIPATGERDHNPNYTLEPSDDEDENTPLIRNRRSLSAPDQGSLKRSFASLSKLLRSPNSRRILKCSLAYYLGSLATYVTPISRLLGRYDGKHMVATLCVYFHPARSAGSMFQATLYAWTAFFYSTFVSLGSMAMASFFDDYGLRTLGHALVLLIFCVGGLGFVGYVKQVKAHPTVSVACSLASISIITILVKEGSIQEGEFRVGKIVQVSIIVIMSIMISTILAFVLWPSSAIADLRKQIEMSLYSFSDTLGGITYSFLTGSDEKIKVGKYGAAAQNHRTIFGTLTKALTDAKYEHYLRGTEREYHQEKLLVESMQRLAQNIGGLRSAALTQATLVKQAQEAPGAFPGAVGINPQQQHIFNHSNLLFTPPERNVSSYLSHSGPFASSLGPTPEEGSVVNESIIMSPLEIYEQFISYLGPPMKSLAYTLTLLLDDLPYGANAESKKPRITVNPRFHESLEKAMQLYADKRAEALNTLYKSSGITTSRSMDANADVEEIAASCHYFSYNILNFAEEMKTFLDILIEMEYLERHRTRSWDWLKFWKKTEHRRLSRRSTITDTEAPPPPPPLPELKRSRTIPNVAPGVKIPFTYKVWRALGILRRDNIKFGIKVGVGAAIFALPAFIPSMRPTFSHWRGEWGLVSYMVVMSMTRGQTNNSGWLRALGSLIGALLALFAWILFPENPYALSVFGWLVSLPCFQIILNWKQATFGRFILLTYNLSCLYAYSLSMTDDDDDDDDEGGINPIITQIVWHRFISVLMGVGWGLFVNWAIWPLSARRQLRMGLSKLWFRMSIMWSKDPLDCLVDGIPDSPLSASATLQPALVSLTSFAAAAHHEFRLKGPFPSAEYDALLKSTQRILDAIHSLHVLIIRDPYANHREAEILAYTKMQRDDLSARISHIFYVLGSAIRTGFPLPKHLPNAVRSRDRLLARVFDYRESVRGKQILRLENGGVRPGLGEMEGEGDGDEDFAGIYAYVLVTGRISEGLEEIVAELNKLYGVLDEEELEI
ncbi:hypothetical protein EX30DRAFT_3064 [Ascodesmis nigricans]|uniref:Uncharacterized protein n=1 Tax=Ascodesmis nigricans TaxID=341454 RepID=A0A4S2N5L0_9PEZI|nr:hypothetical protein EX30DRAFT_3064 [Ascodesmis nigricans]